MKQEDIKREVLELVEEDFYGLWEIGWRLRSAMGIDPTLDAEGAAEAIESLWEQHLVEIYVREWDDDDPQPIASSGRFIDLHEPSAWFVPDEHTPQFLVGSRGV